MKITSTWKNGFMSVVDNGRHKVTMDLPYLQHGKNEGPTALEVSVMGYAGCITTVFALMAEKLKVDFSDMQCVINAKKGEKTIEKVTVLLDICSDASGESLLKAYKLTQNNCPVGVLFEKAGVEVVYDINIRKTGD